MQTRAHRPGVRGVAAALALGGALAGCSPTFNWREARPEGSGVALMFPCRPAHEERRVRIGTAVLPMQIDACSAGAVHFALAFVDAAEATEVTPLLEALRRQSLTNLEGTETASSAFAPPGATPNPQSARVAIIGARPDGRRVVADAAFFVKGLRLFQATVLGAEDSRGREAADTFFGAIRLP
jgi:hypothetical protein